MPFIRKVRVLFKTRLIFPRINGPIVSLTEFATRNRGEIAGVATSTKIKVNKNIDFVVCDSSTQ